MAECYFLERIAFRTENPRTESDIDSVSGIIMFQNRNTTMQQITEIAVSMNIYAHMSAELMNDIN